MAALANEYIMQGNILASFGLTISGKSMLLGVMMEQVMATLKMDSSEAIVPVRVEICEYIHFVGVCHQIPKALKWRWRVGVFVG